LLTALLEREATSQFESIQLFLQLIPLSFPAKLCIQDLKKIKKKKKKNFFKKKNLFFKKILKKKKKKKKKKYFF